MQTSVKKAPEDYSQCTMLTPAQCNYSIPLKHIAFAYRLRMNLWNIYNGYKSVLQEEVSTFGYSWNADIRVRACGMQTSESINYACNVVGSLTRDDDGLSI